MHFVKAFTGMAAAAAALASAAPTTIAARDVAPAFDLPQPELYKAQIVDGFHKARDFILRKPAGGKSDGFQDVLKTKDMDAVVDAWFDHAHGGKQPLLDGYPAELDGIVVGMLRKQMSDVGGLAFKKDEWKPLTVVDFDNFEKNHLNQTIDSHEKNEKDTIIEAESFGFYPADQSREDMLAKMNEMPTFEEYSAALVEDMRDFLQQPILGYASETFGPHCRSGASSWEGCEKWSLEDAAIHWDYMYPGGLKPEPRSDQLTLFDVFMWWNEQINTIEATVESMPFIEILGAWWSKHAKMPKKPWLGDFYAPKLGEDY